ncbi:MAG: hypothetical protein AAB474_01985 [Patescibacteria group bacterium]
MERILVLDVDGVLVDSGWLEKIWMKVQRFLGIESTPKFFFLIKEAIDFIKTPSLKPEAVNFFEQLKTRGRGDYKIGIITDRSYLSLLKICKKNKIFFNQFEFIQVRKSMLDKLNRNIRFDDRIRRCSKVKPHIHIFARLELFRIVLGISEQMVLIIDDSENIRNIASDIFGFKAISSLSIDFNPHAYA